MKTEQPETLTALSLKRDQKWFSVLLAAKWAERRTGLSFLPHRYCSVSFGKLMTYSERARSFYYKL